MKAFEPTRYRDPEEPSFSIMSKNPIATEINSSQMAKVVFFVISISSK